MVEVLGELIDSFIEPILRFADVYIGEDGYLRPIGSNDPSLVYQYEGKDVIVVKTDLQFDSIKDKKDEYEIFNPFIVHRHMTFICNLIKQKVTEISDTLLTVKEDDVDLDDEELESNPVMELVDKVEIFQSKTPDGLLKLEFCYIDSNFNPVKVITEYSHFYPTLALYGLCLNAVKEFKPIVPPQLKDTDLAIMAIAHGLNKYDKEKRKRGNRLTGYQAIDMVDDDGDYIAMDYADEDYVYDLNVSEFISPFDKKESVENTVIKIDLNNFKTKTIEEIINSDDKETVSKIDELLFNTVKNRFDEVELDL